MIYIKIQIQINFIDYMKYISFGIIQDIFGLRQWPIDFKYMVIATHAHTKIGKQPP